MTGRNRSNGMFAPFELASSPGMQLAETAPNMCRSSRRTSDHSRSRVIVVACALAVSASVASTRGARADDLAAFQLSAGSGYAELEGERYIELSASGMFRLGPIRADFNVPLRFDATNLDFRTEDWDELRDYARVARCVRLDIGDHARPTDQFDPSCRPYGSSDGRLHGRAYFTARAYSLANESLGHATLVNNYRNSLDLDRPELGVSTQLIASDWGELDVVVGDVARPRFVAGRAMLRPPNLFGRNWDETPEDMEVGVTWAADLGAPMRLETTDTGAPALDANGDVRFERSAFHAIGVDAHYLHVFGHRAGTPVNGALFVFADYNRFLGVADGDGVHGGLRAVVRKGPINLVTAGVELRWLGARYYPGVFDADYSVRSQRFALTERALELPGVTEQTTLQERIRSGQGGRRLGFQAYLALQIPLGTNGETPRVLPLIAYLEDAQGPANATAGIIVGPLRLGPLALSAQYLRRDFDGLAHVFRRDGMLLRIRGRLALSATADNPLSRVSLEARYDRRFFQNTSGTFDQTNDFEAMINYVHTGN